MNGFLIFSAGLAAGVVILIVCSCLIVSGRSDDDDRP